MTDGCLHHAHRALASPRPLALWIVAALALGACEGSIGETGPEPDTERPDPRDPTLPDPESLDRLRVPLRPLTTYELQGSLESLGLSGRAVSNLENGSGEKVETLRPAWSGSQVELLDGAMMEAAQEILAGPLGRCGEGDRDCVVRELGFLAARAYRRPIDADEASNTAMIYDELVGTVGHEAAMVRATQAILLSAEFLYLPAIGEADQLTDLEFASRLSYFLLSAPPDEELSRAAAAGELRSAESRREHATRLLRDDRASNTIARVVVDWLGGLQLSSHVRHDDRWLNGIPSDALAETRAFVAEWFLSSEASFARLFAADHTFVTPALAELYGFSEEVSADGLTRVENTAARGRSGLLTQATFLGGHALPNAPSSTKRGKWFVIRAMCRDISLPEVNSVDTSGADLPNETTRVFHEALMASRDCGGCHNQMEPFGLAFENYGPLGEWRELDNGHEVHGRTTLPSGTGMEGTYDGAVELSAAFGQNAVARRCFSSRWLTLALGRPPTRADEALITSVSETLETDVHEAALRIVLSDEFSRSTTLEAE